ncbi:MAG: Arc family DNA-binding protein [Clostridia bacterium]|nr:Arc family DNA-binding protein [Clostridia bacterium]
MGKSSTTAKNKYNTKSYDQVKLLVKKGQRDIIKAVAEKQGKSVNAYIYNLIENDFKRLGESLEVVKTDSED